jgi:hypothetical protein
MKNIDTDKIHNLFYESHKEVDKIAGMFDINEQTATPHVYFTREVEKRWHLYPEVGWSISNTNICIAYTLFPVTYSIPGLLPS